METKTKTVRAASDILKGRTEVFQRFLDSLPKTRQESAWREVSRERWKEREIAKGSLGL
jgi:hypothetical protein